MADKLQKFKYDSATEKPSRPNTRQQAAEFEKGGDSQGMPSSSDMGEDLKSQMLASLRDDITHIIREEFKNALANDFAALKTEVQAVRAEIANSANTASARFDAIETDLQEVKDDMSSWSDDITTLQKTVKTLQSEVMSMRDKCEDMEGRMRRGNIRVVGLVEQPNSSSPAELSRIIKQVLQWDRDVKIDRSHRGAPRKPGDDRPRVIIAKMHYDGDAVDILRRAREKAPLMYNGKRISIFQDYTTGVAKARSAFSDARKALQGRRDVRFGLFYPARFRITFKNDTKEFTDPAKAMVYIQNTIHAETEGDS